MENNTEVPQRIRTAIWSNSFTSGYLLKENNSTNSIRYMESKVHAALFTIVKMWMQSKCFGSVQSLSRIWFLATPWAAACQASLSITNSWSLLKLMSIESVMPPSHLILCRPLLLPPSMFPSIRVFSNESVLCIRWPKYWSVSFSVSPSSAYSGLIFFRIDWLDLLAAKGLSRVFSNTTVQKHLNVYW